jgi:pyruvate dehydrogenase E2 component (dihydrolipoamide acetyltransferase)
MADTVQMPKLGFDMAEGTLVRWVKAEGDPVNKGEVLAEIETDKATVEVESQFGGVVLKHLVDEKAIVPVGSPIAIIGQPGESFTAAAPVPGSAGAPPQPGGEPAPGPTSPAGSAAAAPSAVGVVAAPLAAGMVKASPLARRMAGDVGLDLRQLQGSGPGGRIVRKDVERMLQQQPVPAVVPAAVSAVPITPAPPQPVPLPYPKPAVVVPLPSLAAGEVPPDQRIPVDRLRSAIGRRMVESKQQFPHFYVTHEYDVEKLVALRKTLNELLPEDAKLSVHDFIVRAVALCLRRFPNLNASFAGNEIVRHGHVNVGTAVAIEGGVMTVVCTDTDLKPLRLISQEVRAMSTRARAGKIRPEDVEGSTFSISNLGMFDVENFAAIITPPEAAVLAVGTARQVPVVGPNGELKVGMRMKATISADHRVTDGAEAAQFMKALADYIEEPMRLML